MYHLSIYLIIYYLSIYYLFNYPSLYIHVFVCLFIIYLFDHYLLSIF